MQVAGHLSGGAAIHRRVKIGATFSNAGIPTIYATGTPAGVVPATTTSFIDSLGLAVDTGTYSASQGTTHAEGLVTVNLRPDAILRTVMSGGATEGTALTLLLNTAASTDGLTITDADVGSADMVSGTVWCVSGANLGRSRKITTHTGSTSFAVTVAFDNDIAVGDGFLFCPWALMGSGASDHDGVGHVQLTTNLYQADASIASGTGGAAVIFDLELNGRSDSYVQCILGDHQYQVYTN